MWQVAQDVVVLVAMRSLAMHTNIFAFRLFQRSKILKPYNFFVHNDYIPIWIAWSSTYLYLKYPRFPYTGVRFDKVQQHWSAVHRCGRS